MPSQEGATERVRPIGPIVASSQAKDFTEARRGFRSSISVAETVRVYGQGALWSWPDERGRAVTHDCRFHNCVPCYPWEEGVHNFRHRGRTEACDCDRCPQERPAYPEYPPGRSWKSTTASNGSEPRGPREAAEKPQAAATGSIASR